MSGIVMLGLNIWRERKICWMTRIGRQEEISCRGRWESRGGNGLRDQVVSSVGGQEIFGNKSEIGISNGNYVLGLFYYISEF